MAELEVARGGAHLIEPAYDAKSSKKDYSQLSSSRSASRVRAPVGETHS
jgi:hypothetical protein